MIKQGGVKAEQALTDDQLNDLFSEMKRENQEKREQEMKRFKIEAGPAGALLEDEELGGLEDSDEEEVEKVDFLAPTEKLYNDHFKQELEAYRRHKKAQMNQVRTVEGNLDAIF